MESKIVYVICPECGLENNERRWACPRCDNRMFSDGLDEHRRYHILVTAEHRKRVLLWYVGWTLVAVTLLGPLVLLSLGRDNIRTPTVASFISSLVMGWRLIDLKKKREASATFLVRHKNG